MAKYSLEFKLQVVTEYLSGKGSYESLAKKHQISSKEQIREWVEMYKAFGVDSLARKRENAIYSLDFKLNVVECYLTTELSYQDLAISFEINNPALIASWVSKFRKNGIDGLSGKKGRPPKMKSIKKEKETIKEIQTEEQSEYVKKLEKELLHLKIENAYLKELRRLRLEDAQKQKELQESSTVSEKNSR